MLRVCNIELIFFMLAAGVRREKLVKLAYIEK